MEYDHDFPYHDPDDEPGPSVPVARSTRVDRYTSLSRPAEHFPVRSNRSNVRTAPPLAFVQRVESIVLGLDITSNENEEFQEPANKRLRRDRCPRDEMLMRSRDEQQEEVRNQAEDGDDRRQQQQQHNDEADQQQEPVGRPAEVPAPVLVDRGEIRSQEAAAETWECPQCAVQNRRSEMVCRMCGTAPRLPALPNAPPLANGSLRHREDEDHVLARQPAIVGAVCRDGVTGFVPVPTNTSLRHQEQEDRVLEQQTTILGAEAQGGNTRIGQDRQQRFLRTAAALLGADSIHRVQMPYMFGRLGGDVVIPRGAQRSEIEALPTRVITTQQLQALPPEAQSCTVCLADLVAGDTTRTLPCLHIFHPGCIDKWLRLNGTCPICKTPVY